MSKDTDLIVAPLFVALTRPPMFMGVTLEYFAIAGMVAMGLFIGLGNPLYLMAYLPLHVLGWLVCHYDPNGFRVLLTSLECLPVPNRRYWGCQSYDPS